MAADRAPEVPVCGHPADPDDIAGGLCPACVDAYDLLLEREHEQDAWEHTTGDAA